MSCERFEHEFLVALEQGRELDPHVLSCEDCRAARYRYMKLIGAIRLAGANDVVVRGGLSGAALHPVCTPSPDWEARVWARIAKGGSRRPGRWRWPLFALAASATLAVILLLWMRGSDAPTLLVAVESRSDRVLRSTESAHPGDRLVLTVNAGDAQFAAVRVYRDQRELLLDRALPSGGGHVQVSVELPSVGTYRALLLRSVRALPEGHTTLDDDVSRATAAGAKAKISLPIEVN